MTAQVESRVLGGGSIIVDGKAIAAQLRADIAKSVARVVEKCGSPPGLAVIVVGDDPASQVYVRNKGIQARECGMNSFVHKLPSATTQQELLQRIADLGADSSVNGILVQLPLPDHISEGDVIRAIPAIKDVDGFHPENVGALATGEDCLAPCTPLGCIMLLKHVHGTLAGLRALVIGRSNIVGKPVAQMLLREHCTVTIAHSRTRDLAAECRNADIIVAAIGKPLFVRGEWIKQGATVIDVGINRTAKVDGTTALVGDVDFEAASTKAGAITPVPGGVGPMTIACLLQNTLRATCRQRGMAELAI